MTLASAASETPDAGAVAAALTRENAAPIGWPDVLTALLRGEDLAPASASWAMDEIMSGEATPTQVAGFLVALRAKGETSAEIRAIADVMLQHAHRIQVDGPSIDIVGTGGDRAQTVNISTMSALVAAAAGVRVAKHGNRAASSKSGTADCLEALGIDLGLRPDEVEEVVAEAGITFCFAQMFHPAMRHVAIPRRELGVPTVFNVLGPLTNPAEPTFAAIGVANPRMAPLVAGVLADRGQRAAVFRGDDGLDEITVSTTSTVWWVDGGRVTEFRVSPPAHGLDLSPLETLRGGDGAHNAQVVLDVFDGARGPIRDAVLLNSGIALAIAGGDEVTDQAGFDAALSAGITRAAQAIDGGLARQTLDRWRDVTVAVASRRHG